MERRGYKRREKEERKRRVQKIWERKEREERKREKRERRGKEEEKIFVSITPSQLREKFQILDWKTS